MKRTQIQLPNEMYARLKELARVEETTLAEIIRQAAAYLLQTQPIRTISSPNWVPPKAEDLGEFMSTEEDWRIYANE
ncbi:MAG: CopG family transcriptional regulator [Spirochaetales bacterium]|nr:CopG family transcriptional regulator [Spirochaetales bacterium]